MLLLLLLLVVLILTILYVLVVVVVEVVEEEVVVVVVVSSVDGLQEPHRGALPHGPGAAADVPEEVWQLLYYVLLLSLL